MAVPGSDPLSFDLLDVTGSARAGDDDSDEEVEVEGGENDDGQDGGQGDSEDEDDPSDGQGGDDTTDDQGNRRNQTRGLNDDDVISGGEGDDRLVGGANDDILDGGAGNDRLNGNSGDDLLIGGAGDDLLQGGAGADVFLFDFEGGQTAPGNDVVRDFNAGAGDVLRFINILPGDLDEAVEGIEDDGRDVTIRFQKDSSLTLDGLGTGAIGTIADLLSEIGNDSIEMVA